MVKAVGRRLRSAWRQRRHARKQEQLKYLLASHDELLKRKKKLAELQKRRILRVAFQVAQLSKWKSASVLQLMKEHEQFSPMVWMVSPGLSDSIEPEELRKEQNRISLAFKDAGVPFVSYESLADFPADERPDIIFIHEAYDCIFDHPSYAGLEDELLCYVPYCFHNTNDAEEFNGMGNACALFNFYENAYIAKMAAASSWNHGENIVVTGNPIADSFASAAALAEPVWKDAAPGMKHVIWAPHWTVSNELCWFACGTFLQTAEIMLELAEKYVNRIQFALKPHPHLFYILSERTAWGEEKTREFFRRWDALPNTQLELGEYTALIMQSDAMIHDSASFILEYLFADKPCMYLHRADAKADFNKMSTDALQCYHFGVKKEEIEQFLLCSVLGREDPKSAVREEMRQRYLLPPNGQSAAQNIVDTLLAVC